MTIKPIDHKQFAEWLGGLDLISPSQQWGDFLKRQYGAAPEFLGFWEGGECRFILPAYRLENGLVGVPKLYTEALAYRPISQPFPIAELLAYLQKQQSFDHIRFDFSVVRDYRQQLTFEKFGLKQVGVCQVLVLPGALDEETILNTLVSHKTRNQIRTAYRRGGFQLVVSDNVEEFYAFYQLHVGRLGKPKEKRFFINLRQSFGNDLKIILAKVDGAIVGANLCLLHKHYLHLMFNVADQGFFKDYVNDWLYWETIKLGLIGDIKLFDFGPSTLGDHSHQHFKSGFGARPLPLYRLVIYHSFRRQLQDWFNTNLRNLGLRLRKH